MIGPVRSGGPGRNSFRLSAKFSSLKLYDCFSLLLGCQIGFFFLSFWHSPQWLEADSSPLQQLPHLTFNLLIENLRFDQANQSEISCQWKGGLFPQFPKGEN